MRSKSCSPPAVTDLIDIWGTYQFAVLFLTLASTGMRSGEVRALTWKRIHIDGKPMDVIRAINSDGSPRSIRSKAIQQG
jgi:integrase